MLPQGELKYKTHHINQDDKNITVIIFMEDANGEVFRHTYTCSIVDMIYMRKKKDSKFTNDIHHCKKCNKIYYDCPEIFWHVDHKPGYCAVCCGQTSP